MATINRFARPVQKDYSWANPQIDVWEPNYNLWLDTLDKQQAQYDTIPALSQLVPKHLEQDRPDVQAYNQTVQADIQRVTDAYTSGDVSAGNQALREVTNKRRADFQPGGAADMFQQRLAQYQGVDKRLQDTYLDPKSDQYSPELYKYYKNNIDVQPYKTDTGYGSVNQPSMNQYFSPEKWTKHIDTVLDNISADQVSIRPGLIPSGVSLKSFFETGNREFIDKSKVLAALNGSVPVEMLQSLDVYGKATGTDAFKQTERMFDAAASGKAYSKIDKNYQGVTDEVALEDLKSRLRTKEEKDKLTMNDVYLRTQIFNSNSGMPEWDDMITGVDEKGNVYKENVTFDNRTVGGNELIGGPKVERQNTGVKFKDWVTSTQAPPQLQGIANEFAAAISGMSDKQAKDFVQQKYEQKRQALANTDAVVQLYDEKERDMWTSALFGVTKGKDGATAGSMFTNDMTVTTIMPGEVGTMTGIELGKKMGIVNTDGTFNEGKLRRLVENGAVTEEMDVPSGVMPSGNKASYVDENGKAWTFVIGPRSLQEETLNNDAYKINQAKLNDATPDFTFQPVNPLLRDQFPAGIKVISRDVYAKDIAYHNYRNAQDAAQKGQGTPQQAAALYQQWKQLDSNPYEDQFIMKDVALINPLTNQPVNILDDDGNVLYNPDGSKRVWTNEDVNNLTRNTKIGN
jgi:hypothetical protein